MDEHTKKMTEILKALLAAEVLATYEHPGYFEVTSPTGRVYVYGDSECGDWGGTEIDAKDGQSINGGIPSKPTDTTPQGIMRWIKETAQ